MATQPNPPPVRSEPRQIPQHFVPPTARELRGQAVQRLQAGLFGVGIIVLLVGLANIINDRARLVDAGQPQAAVNTVEGEGGDPLADIGVVPAASPGPTPTVAPSSAAPD